MAFTAKDRVQVSGSTTGQATYNLGSASDSSYRDFSVLGIGATVTYAAVISGTGFEIGDGAISTSGGSYTLSRLRIISSSNANASVSWAGGATITIFNTHAAERDTGFQLGDRTVLGVGSGTYIPTPGTRAIDVQGVGGGGGGGGAATATGSVSAAGANGNGGGYFRKFITPVVSSYAWSVGAAGAGGATGASGSNAVDTTFAGGGVTLIANGGIGGIGSGAAPGSTVGFGNGNITAGGSASGGDINIPGSPSNGFMRLAASNIAILGGGDSFMGKAPGVVAATTTSKPGALPVGGYGIGGGGALTSGTALGAIGASGTSGVIIIDEYF